MSITDGNWVCSRCLDYKTICNLCEGMAEHLIRTPEWILDKEKKVAETNRLNKKLKPWL